MKQTIFAGMRATGNLHLGNYLGAAKGMLALQEDNKYNTIYMVVDVHAITTPYNAQNLRSTAKSVIMDYLSCGLDPKKSIITSQSLVPQHTELAFYLSSVISVARMQHLPTFKEKVKQHPDSVTMALLNYPVLMAADIMAYKASLIPVGIDQEPHIEVTRQIAARMNDLYNTDFPMPQRFATKAEYVPSLLGEGKMSKSVEGSYINLTDDLDMIKQRLAKVPTDSGKGNKVPTKGSVANLLAFVSYFQGEPTKADYIAQYTSTGIRYKELKGALAKAIFAELEPIQQRRRDIEKNKDYVDDVIADGAKKAREIASATVIDVKNKMGLML